MVTSFERQVRELRSQLNMKTKDVANFREEVAALETRLNAKTAELRSVKSQLQIMTSRYEEVNQDLEHLQLSGCVRKADATRSNEELDRCKRDL